ncbi:MAG: hypothetical protein BMS9Abin05_0188 [Rhodothermia bacterium]|nr:MAG: hypothetical protein BMS9Abin05_0188 [Rhodothermia bacterium]
MLVAAVLLASSPLLPALAQQGAINLGAQRQAVRASARALYQSYDDDTLSVSQLSIPLSVTAPLGNDLTLSFFVSQMSTTGDKMEDLSGLSDAQLILSYARRAGAGSVIISLGANLPTGKKDLTKEEFETAVLISQRAFDFQVPSLGQGFGLSPSVTWAVPVGANTAVGLGASYQVRGTYRPLDTLTGDYTPGNEILLTGGLDTRLNTESTLSLDVTHTIYASDQLREVDIFEAGSKTNVSAMYRYVRGFNELRLVGVYRKRAKSSERVDSVLVTQTIQTIPDQAIVRASYRMRLQSAVALTFLAEGRFFNKSKRYPKRSMIDVGVVPSYPISPQTSLVGRFVYTLGTITGLEAGVGLEIIL